MIKQTLFAAAVVSVLTACAGGAPTATLEQCSNVDWFVLGKSDGTKGESMLALNTPIKACETHGIVPDRDAYVAGRAEGLKTFCQPATLLEATVQGAGDPFSCEPFDAREKTAFETGRDTRAAAMRYQQYQAQYKQLTDAKAQINAEGSRLTQQYNQTTDETTRQQIATRIAQLREQLKQVEAQLAEADPVMKTEEATYQGAIAKYEQVKTGFAQ